MQVRSHERERERARRVFIVLFLLLLFPITVLPIFAEGSYELNQSGKRLYLQNYKTDNPRGVTFRVFLQEGDTVYIGTSSYQATVDIKTIIDGIETNYNVTTSSVGYIKNRTQEVAGPKPLNSRGYTPIEYTADRDKFIDIYLFSASDSAAANVTDAWSTASGLSNNYTFIAAWDITVVNSAGNVVPGRMFSSYYKFADKSQKINNKTFYVLTNDGYIYQVDTGSINGAQWSLAATNRGLVNNQDNLTLYGSVPSNSTNMNNTRVTKMPGIEYFNPSYCLLPSCIEDYSASGDISFPLFVNYPDEDLLIAMGLNEPKPAPEINSFIFSGHYEENKSFIDQGGTFSFVSSARVGTYELKLLFVDDTDGSRTLTFGGQIQAGTNSIEWDGKDKQGDTVQPGDYIAYLTVKNAEIHLVLADIEYIYDGFKFKLLNCPAGYPSTLVYYDNTKKVINGKSTHMNEFICSDSGTSTTCTKVNMVMYNGNLVNKSNKSTIYLYGDPDQSAGIDSYASPAMKTANRYSDGQRLDIWSYNPQVNTYTSEYIIIPVSGMIEVSKVFEDFNDLYEMRPESVQLQLYANGSPEDIIVLSSEGQTGNTWKKQISVPLLDDNDEAINYTVEEIDTPIQYSSQASGLSVKNILKTHDDLIVVKQYMDDNDRDGYRSDTVYFQIVMDGYTLEQTYMITAADDWSVAISDLPQYNSDGILADYSVIEIALPNIEDIGEEE